MLTYLRLNLARRREAAQLQRALRTADFRVLTDLRAAAHHRH